MPAVTPAEQHTPYLFGASNRHPFAWSTQSCVPRRQSWRRMASAPRCPAFGAQALFVGQPLPVVQAAVVGQAFLPAAGIPAGLGPPYPPPSAPPNAEPCRGGPACPPLLLRSPCSCMLSKRRCSSWSKPPGLPCRRSRRQSNTHRTCSELPIAIRSHGARNLACHTRCSRGARSLACHAASLGGGWLLPLVAPLLGRKLSLWASLFLWCRPLLWGRLSSLRRAFQPAWAPLTRRLLSPDAAAPRGASRQACHAGGHAGRATQS